MCILIFIFRVLLHHKYEVSVPMARMEKAWHIFKEISQMNGGSVEISVMISCDCYRLVESFARSGFSNIHTPALEVLLRYL